MLCVDRDSKALKQLGQRSLPEAGWKEREDLQQMIRNSPDAFFAEMGESLLLLGEEVRPTDFVDDRIDLLALDPNGASVVIELKRGNNKLQLLQAISYAAMVAKWDGARLLEERQTLTGRSQEEVESEVEEFLEEDFDHLNSSQRVILIAGDFDYEVLVASEWLSDTYGVDVRCYRLTISAEADSEYLSCTCVFPPPELTQHAVPRGKGSIHSMRWKDWDEALTSIDNPAIVDFFRKELEAGRENYLRKRTLHFCLNGKRRLSVGARKATAYVWQNRRFEGDEVFWTETIGEHINVGPVKRGGCLRFFLSQESDFAQFLAAVEGDLTSVNWLAKGELPISDEDEDTDED